MKIGDEVFVHGYVDEIRNDVVIIRNDGGYFGTVPGEIDRKDEPFDKDINVRSKDEPKTQMKTQNSNLTFEKRTMRDCYNCERYETEDECIECHYEPKDECAKEYEELGLKELKELIEADRKDEPQTDGYMTAEQTEDYRKMLDKAEHKVYGNIEDEPQTDCAWGKTE